MTNTITYRDKTCWILFLLTFVMAGISAYLDLSEFISISILKHINGYPFGGEGSTPWYYKSSRLYSSVMLFFAVCFIITLILSIVAFLKHKKSHLLMTFIAAILLIIIQILNGYSE